MPRILVVDDLEYNVFALSTLLKHSGYDVVEAFSGQEALLLAQSQELEGIVLDVQMPGMDGFEVCRRLKSDPKTAEIPVMFVSGTLTDEASVIKGLQLGANEYVVKPVANSELLARVSVMVRIKEAEEEARRVSVTDELTGLYNRRFLLRRMAEEICRARRQRTPLCCMVIDIDHFKRVNDTYGHTFGDYVLRNLAQKLTTLVRAEDIVARYGGEEFVIILACPPSRASEVAERLRAHIEEAEFQAEDHSTPVTVSIGVGASLPERPLTAQALFKQADAALYSAKRSGRNRVVLSTVCEQMVHDTPPSSRR